MKKKLLTLLAGLLSVSMLTSCGGGGGTSGGGGEAQGGGDSAKPVITFTYRNDGSDEQSPLYLWASKAYESWDKKDEVELNIAPITASEGDYFTKIALQLSDSSTCPDLVAEDTFQLPNDAAAGYLSDMTEMVSGYGDWAKYYESMQNLTTIDGTTYGIPYCTDTRGLWYNRAVLEDAGVIEAGQDWAPATWADVLDACAKIKEASPDVVPFWCNAGKATGEATSMQTYEMLLYGTGERLMDADGNWIVDSKGIRDSLGFLQDIYVNNNWGPTLDIILTGTGSTTGEQQYLPQGRAGILLDGIWITGPWMENGVAPWANYQDEVGLAPMPTSEGQDPGHISLTGGWALSLPENGNHKDLAWEFVQHMMDPAVYCDAVVSMGNLCTRKDVAEMEQYASIPFFQEATDFLEFADYRPQNDSYSTVTTSIQSMVESVVSGVSIDSAVAQYGNEVAGYGVPTTTLDN